MKKRPMQVAFDYEHVRRFTEHEQDAAKPIQINCSY
jgi:hypothetical protein